MTDQPLSLVILAAGMGSRFGGLKQLTPVGPSGELMIDYSIHDALAAGFNRVVFIIKHAIEKEFKEQIGDRIAAYAPVEYVFQELDRLPDGFSVPDGREKPWGTGHAVLCCEDTVTGPFAVINADDYYGRECFQLLADFLKQPKQDDRWHIAMAGYQLENTLTENGYVSRGICEVDENNTLTSLVERTHIELKDGVPMFTEDDGETWHRLPAGAPVSMNCWAFPAGIIGDFREQFVEFLKEKGQELKSEFYLPFAVNGLVDAGEADVTVLPTRDKWYGMTYAADMPMVRAALKNMADTGIYGQNLWDK
ncbi:MAG: NTP transferase domain-containing protein [Clostridia bacterium]|nr:NTP transferase domain-containing protein [Clostridia bacterium]